MKKYFTMGKSPYIKRVATDTDQSADKIFGSWEVTETRGLTQSNNILTAKQVHGGNIVRATQVTNGTEADGIFLTNDSDQAVGVMTADCVPVIIMTENKALALHVSRKTLVNGLLDNVLNYLEPKEIDYIYVGPHICEYHFSFAREELMLRRFRLRFGRATHWHHGSIYLSLKTALQYFFDEWEMHPDKIHYDGRCTYEMLALPSYRRGLDSGQTGKIGSLITAVRRRSVT